MKSILTGIFLLGLALMLSAGHVKADGVNGFAVSSTYASNAGSSPFSAPNENIGFQFSVPHNSGGGDSVVSNVAITVSFGGTMTFVTGDITFYALASNGLFNIDFTDGGNSYEWEFSGLKYLTVRISLCREAIRLIMPRLYRNFG